MPLSLPAVHYCGLVTVIVLLLLSAPQHVVAQGGSPLKKDTATNKKNLPQADSTSPRLDSLLKALPKQAVKNVTSQLKDKAKALKHNFTSLPVIPVDTSRLTFPNERLFGKPLIAFKGGYINYNYNYRSNIDTPFAEKDISQHNIIGSVDFTLGNVLPVKVNYWVRQSNSGLFQDIADVQLLFDAAGFRNNLNNNLKKRLLALAPKLQDSLLEKLYNTKLDQLKSAKDWLGLPVNTQQLREYNELIQIPALGYDANLPDSVNRKRSDSLLLQAKAFIAIYDSARQQYDRLAIQVDSAEKQVTEMRSRIRRYRETANGHFGDWASYSKWKSQLRQYQPELPAESNKYEWLLGIRNFSLGKSPVNYSELTAKNINVTGINIEYNSWYYFSVTAGVVDYRFRDFMVNRFSKTPQYLYMARLGIGRLEGNYFILSAYKGRKQLYATANNSSRSSSINITGFSAETKWQVNRTTYVIAEAAESLSPDYRMSPPVENAKFTFTDKINKALSVKFYTTLPKMAARIEGMYKYTGANFQSFSSFQTNAAAQSWYVKWEQGFFKRKLRITGSLKSNEFTNPYIVQNYKSNTVFKSVTAVFRTRKWPVVSVGYVPMSQLTIIGGQVLESRFQTLTASLNHFYKIGTKQMVTTMVYNRFYNSSSDTGFIYFNSTNLYVAQQFVFHLFSLGMAVSHSRNNQYELNVMDGNMHINFRKNISVGFGIKINSLDKLDTRLGGYMSGNVRIGQKDMVYISYEKGYLPGWQRQLVGNTMGTIQYSRSF